MAIANERSYAHRHRGKVTTLVNFTATGATQDAVADITYATVLFIRSHAKPVWVLDVLGKESFMNQITFRCREKLQGIFAAHIDLLVLEECST